MTKTFKYWQWRTIFATMIGYAIFYFVRKNFSFAIPGLTAEYGISKTSFGIIMTLVTVVYGASRFLNGYLADRFNARYHMAIGLLLCAAANYAFGFGADLSYLITGESSGPQFVNTMVFIFGLFLLLNNLFQGSGFPPCNRLLTHWIPANELATKMSIWNTSHSIGASIVAILCGYIMATMGHGAWKWCFWIPATIALVGAIGIYVFLRDTPSSVGLPELHTINKKGKEGGTEYKAFLRKMVFRNKWIWILAIANFMVYIVRFAVLDWGPTFLKEARGMSLANAGWTVAIFEIFGIIGMIVSGWLTDHVFKGKAHRTCFWFMAGVAVFMTIFVSLPAGTSMPVMVVVLAMAGFFIYGPQALIGIAASNQATNRAAATANGLIGMFGYASGIVSGIGVGMLVDAWGNWDYVFYGMIGIAVLCVAVFTLMWNAKADGYAEEETTKQ